MKKKKTLSILKFEWECCPDTIESRYKIVNYHPVSCVSIKQIE